MNGKKLVVAILLGGLLYVAGQYVSSQPQRIQKEAAANREITVQGTGKIQTKPDIAQYSLGVTTGSQASAAVAITTLTNKFNAVLNAVKQQGVKADDIKTTNLSINPVYDWNNGKQTLRGFEASENIEIKIRDLNKIGDILAKSTVEGVNQAGGIQFIVDDPDKLQTETQKKAIEDAQGKAKELAKSLGVSLGKVKTFSASATLPNVYPMYTNSVSLGAGDSSLAKSPEVPTGTQEITANVTIVYELK
jgi:uncharacterized protein YggE